MAASVYQTNLYQQLADMQELMSKLTLPWMSTIEALNRYSKPVDFDTYSEIDRLVEYLNTIDNLYCIGRNGQHRYNNMDHSMVTAFVAADVIRGTGKKADLWAVNTEKSYHEEKKN